MKIISEKRSLYCIRLSKVRSGSVVRKVNSAMHRIVVFPEFRLSKNVQ